MELVSSSRSVLPYRGGLAVAAPSRTASGSSRRRRTSGFGCALGCGGEGKSVAGGTIRRRAALALLLASPAMSVAFSAHGKTKSKNPYDERRLLEQNKKIQEANRAPDDFPNFIREGFEVKVVTSDSYITRDSGLIYEDIKVGTGNSPKDGFEEGIRDMKPGGKRRIIIPPELGPPVGPSTFFSAKQFEVFDVELLAVQDCQRRTIAFYSDVVCS
ncbi:peptidyl-prolyl cis-trans isomerase FKBP20-2, chloroplastic isoform X2 [Oryza brachyantha]|uniref:peptidyl-prolyl cis-trans isomerase FKBP20-2, chloroplastic isoform X2 n=1 Tax=Oryza brachyantha TaxID=4533 RepID=UPI000776556B|nr:peptidyl-prolyl cis-trans isomerase FKBP20-2, chloroplastic isoform X2 [Oryza brachyantha]